MTKRKFLFLTCALLLIFSIVVGQITNVAYADSNKPNKNHTDNRDDDRDDDKDKDKNDSLEKYLKPLLNVKVKKGAIIITNGLVNSNGRKKDIVVNNISYKITVEPFYKTKSSKTWVLESSKTMVTKLSGAKLKPGRIKEFQGEDVLNMTTGAWNNKSKKGNAVTSGKYVATLEWDVDLKGEDDYKMSISKVFTVNQKDLNQPVPSQPVPNQPQIPVEKPRVYVDLKTTKQDGRLKVDFALINESANKVAYDFNSSKQYDIVVTRGNQEVYRWSLDKNFLYKLTSISVPAEGKYQFPAVYWDCVDKDKNKVTQGNYTVKVEVIPENKSALEKNYELGLYDTEEVTVNNDDVRYGIDAVLNIQVIDRQLKLNLVLRNRTTQDVSIWHQSGQKLNVTITDEKGNPVYQSDEGMSFITALTETKLLAGEVKEHAFDTLDLTSMNLNPGVYKVKADLMVSYVANGTGSIIDSSNYNLVSEKTVKLTEINVNKYVAVIAKPKVVDGKLNIPISLVNVSGSDLRLDFASDTDYLVIIEQNGIVYTYAENHYTNTAIGLKSGETKNVDNVIWDMWYGNKRINGKVNIRVILFGDVAGKDDRNADWETVQEFVIP